MTTALIGLACFVAGIGSTLVCVWAVMVLASGDVLK